MKLLLILFALLLSCGIVEAGEKRVEIGYDDFLKMISMKEHSDRTSNQKAAENAVLVKLRDEQGTIIKVQAEQIKNCEGIVRTQEQLSATQEEIEKAVQAELMQVKRELEEEKSNWKWWAGGGAISGAVVGAVIMLMVVN